MTFSFFKPVQLFVFERQTLVWRLNSSSEDRVIDGETYLAAKIERDEIRQTVERAKDRLGIRFDYVRNPNIIAPIPSTQSLGDQWWPYIPSSPVIVTCMTWDDETEETTTDWIGQVVQPKFADLQMELICEPTDGKTQAINQGPKWQKACWKAVYSTGLRGCNLALITTDATLTVVDGLTLTAPEFATAPFNLQGGSLRWVNGDGITERRMIMTHSGTVITVLYGSPDFAVDLDVVAVPNCDRTWDACDARGNTINYGGAIYKPSKNRLKESMSWG